MIQDGYIKSLIIANYKLTNYYFLGTKSIQTSSKLKVVLFLYVTFFGVF